jgi:hypothetical protein
MNDADQAEHVLNNLRQKREAIVARGRELSDERAAIALDAHTGNNKATKRLMEINAALALHASEIEGIDAALKAASEKLAVAQAAEAQAAQAAKAAEAQKLVKEIGECFPYLDKHLAEAARALIAIYDGVVQLHAAGFSFPSDAQLRLGLTTVLQSWAHGLPRSIHDHLRDGFEFLPPGRRQSASEYFAAIEPSLLNQINQHLGKPESARAKEDADA